mgnify:CR=1 FL=1
MNWWDIVKTKLPDDHDERVSREHTERVHGFTPYRLGSLKALNDLRGNYNNIKGLANRYEFKKSLKIYLTIYDRHFADDDDERFLSYSVEFKTLSVDERGVDHWQSFPILHMKDEEEILKYFMDWVEIYRQPNHTYKNIEARNRLSPISKKILAKFKPLNDIKNVVMRDPKIVGGTIEEDIWKFEVDGFNAYMTDYSLERAAIIQQAGALN